MTHATLAPSAASRWIPCPGSLALSARQPPEDDSPEAVEGTRVHAVFTELLTDRPPSDDAIADVLRPLIDRHIRPMITGDMMLYTEIPIPIPSVHESCFGTPDAWAICHDRRRLYIWDLKWGHRHVASIDNPQLMLYASGVIDLAGLPDDYSVQAVIIQPRCYTHPSVHGWTTTVADVRHQASVAARSAEVALLPGAAVHTGPHCMHCPGAIDCEALQQVGRDAMDTSGRSTPLDMTPDEIGSELTRLRDAADRLKARIDALEARALAALKAGATVPGWRIGYTSPHVRWTIPPETVITLGVMAGIDLAVLGTVTPTQAIKKGMDDSVVRAYSERPPGTARIEPISPTDAKRVLQGAVSS